MYKDQYDRIVVNNNELFDLLYSGKLRSLKHVYVELSLDIEKYIQTVYQNNDQYDLPKLVDNIDIDYKNSWLIPKKYKNFDIISWLVEQCKTDVELDRVSVELELYVKYDLIPVLLCIKYLVDVMRENNVVWGLGRGSSVSSYCLYLIGLHKIDSIKYDLDIQEFFKENKNDEKSL